MNRENQKLETGNWKRESFRSDSKAIHSLILSTVYYTFTPLSILYSGSYLPTIPIPTPTPTPTLIPTPTTTMHFSTKFAVAAAFVAGANAALTVNTPVRGLFPHPMSCPKARLHASDNELPWCTV
jgi:hypothetical protein